MFRLRLLEPYVMMGGGEKNTSMNGKTEVFKIGTRKDNYSKKVYSVNKK